MFQEKIRKGVSGWLMVLVLTAVAIAGIGALQRLTTGDGTPAEIAGVIFVLALDVGCWFGLIVINPNTAKAMLLFGDYRGTIKDPGFWWVNPLTVRRTI